MSDFLARATHGVKQEWLESDSRPAVLLSVVAVVLTLVASLYLGLVSRTAAQGRRIEQLQAQILHLQRENQQLLVDIADASAFPELKARAVALGFVPAERVQFIERLD